jgi:hypothetical protein
MTSWPDDHPDLRDIGDALQHRLDRILEAEQAAAAVLARRATALRDRLLDVEGDAGALTVFMRNGPSVAGSLHAVCADHIEIRTPDRTVLVLFDEIASVEMP